ncbi:MAG: hypothetical protein O7C55_08075 [Rickettsia endosymbiont of Ixodes persulcatus]|nr:hypothetical protein [Rickettsia endosymbiont of Ixodes persulcatus]
MLDPEYKTLAVFAIYQPKGLSLLIKRTISYLFNHKIKIIIIAPHPINKKDIQFLIKNECILLKRLNFGRDFGGYKYGILYLLANPDLLKPFTKILLLNDGIVFPVKEYSNTLENLLKYPHNVVGLAENYEYRWHIGSYFILFNKNFLLSQPLQIFWKSYKPYSSRLHTIKKGEILLGQTISKLTDSYKIVYSGNALLTAIKNSSPSQLIQLLPNDFLIKNSLLPNIFYLKKYINYNILGKHIETQSLPHIFSLILIEYLDCFFIKRDICYRGLYSISYVIHYLNSISKNKDLIEEFNIDLKNKGSTSSMPFFKKILCIAGVI